MALLGPGRERNKLVCSEWNNLLGQPQFVTETSLTTDGRDPYIRWNINPQHHPPSSHQSKLSSPSTAPLLSSSPSDKMGNNLHPAGQGGRCRPGLCFLLAHLLLMASASVKAFSLSKGSSDGVHTPRLLMAKLSNNENDSNTEGYYSPTRRDLVRGVGILTATSLVQSTTQPVHAQVGTLPEFADTNAILQGITVNVADASQKDTMIAFLQDSFDFKILRRRIKGTVEETWLGFGPEQLSIPDGFQIPVSAFAEYGGHASIHVRYDSSLTAPLYRQGDDAPGTNIAYLQLGVPGYRISQMVANGGKIMDAYGLVNVVSPAGLPIRGIVGISPDPIMFVAVNCQDVKASQEFYEKLGFVEQEVPYSRPSKGTTIFEPAPPKGAVYMSPSPNCMGVLLLPSKQKKGIITPNPAVESLNIVYKPSGEGGSAGGDDLVFKDPSGVPVRFQSTSDFTALEKVTR